MAEVSCRAAVNGREDGDLLRGTLAIRFVLLTTIALSALITPAFAAEPPKPGAVTTPSAVATPVSAPSTATTAAAGGGGAVGDSSTGLFLLIFAVFAGAGTWAVLSTGKAKDVAGPSEAAAEGDDSGDGCRLALTGPDGQRRVSVGLPAVAGRSSSADIPILDAEVSGYHARLTCGPAGGLHVVDLGSSNGLFVGEERVSEADLARGESFRIGATVVTYEGSGPQAG